LLKGCELELFTKARVVVPLNFQLNSKICDVVSVVQCYRKKRPPNNTTKEIVDVVILSG